MSQIAIRRRFIRHFKNPKKCFCAKAKKETLISTKQSPKTLLSRLKPFLIGSAVITSLSYFVASTHGRNNARTEVVKEFCCERDELIDLEKKLNFDGDALKEITEKSLLKFGDLATMANVNDFIDIVYEIYNNKDNGESKPKLYKWEILCLYRKSPSRLNSDGQIEIPLRELLSPLTVLNRDENREEKLRLIFDLHSFDQNGQKTIGLAELDQIFEKTVRFRHFYADSLLKKVKTFPLPQYRQFTAKEMAQIVLREAKTNTGNETLKTLNFEDFSLACKATSKGRWFKDNFEMWYLTNH